MFGASLNDTIFTVTSQTVNDPSAGVSLNIGEGGSLNDEFKAQQPTPKSLSFLKVEEAQQSFVNPNNFILLGI